MLLKHICSHNLFCMETLQSIANALVVSGKGILAADESTGTIAKRFEKIGVENTEENRRAYRELLFTTKGMNQYISGVILFDETLRQPTENGVPFTKLLTGEGVIPGIKVDKGTKPFAESPNEMWTDGLDGLAERLKEYYDLGARFAKWRVVYRIIGSDIPSQMCYEQNAKSLARYASLCQQANIVPIVEPEVLMDAENSTHGIERCYEVTTAALQSVFAALTAEHVELSGVILKPNMVIPGKDFGTKATPEQVAEMTIRCLKENVPAEVPGIVFLSGGQTDEEACANLNAMQVRGEKLPWELSFSYGRGLQSAALKAWMGKLENVTAAQEAFYQSAQLTSAARMGKYSK